MIFNNKCVQLDSFFDFDTVSKGILDSSGHWSTRLGLCTGYQLSR